MRGVLSVFTRERSFNRFRTGVFLATAEPELIQKVLVRLKEEWPNVDFTLLGPRAYDDIFSGFGSPLWLEDVKLEPWHALKRLRRERFDIAAVVLAGRPTFLKPKLLTFLLNPLRFIIFNENADGFLFDRTHWSTAGRQMVRRCRFLHAGPVLFVPFGFSYLLLRTVGLALSRQVRLSEAAKMKNGSN
jgi:hypothetical protein